jgi:hypothetical protein
MERDRSGRLNARLWNQKFTMRMVAGLIRPIGISRLAVAVRFLAVQGTACGISTDRIALRVQQQ